MRAAGLSSIHQTLTPEAAGVLNQSIAEAARRNHGQTTPLHVAAELLSSPSGYLRQACIRSHPNSSHPLQCRALELCFSVALERLATAQAVPEPPLSNALIAALKRAQANHRRGFPDPPPPNPLLAVRVDLDQLIVSMLDDPSVSRVMREAGFSSPAVKSTIERSARKPNTTQFLPNSRTYYLHKVRDDQLKGVLDIMLRINRRNPILVGDSDPDSVLKSLLTKLTENNELGILNNIEVITMEKGSDSQVAEETFKDLGEKIEGRIGEVGIVINLGDLKWLMEQRFAVVAEMSKLLARFRRDNASEGNKLWFIGTATCETYLRCQVYHSTIETDWDLQALPVPSPLPVPDMFPRIGVVSNVPESCHRTTFCPKCSCNYEREVAKLEAIDNSFSFPPSLPRWLRNTNNELRRKEDRVLSLRKKWQDTCLHLHPNFNINRHFDRAPPPMLSMTTTYEPNLFGCPTLSAPKPPRSPVRTDLALGRKDTESNQANDFIHYISSLTMAKTCDDDEFNNTYKKLVKSLLKMVWWQAEAASTVASAIAKWKSGNGKHGGTRGDMWLLFTGPDRAGKKKTARVLAEHVCGAHLLTISLGTHRCNQEVGLSSWGQTIIDQIAEAIQRNPYSTIMLEDIDETDVVVCGSISHAIERGRFVDSHGHEVSLGNTMFILTGDWSAVHPEASRDGRFVDETRLTSVASVSWQIGFIVREKNTKRQADWLVEDRNMKPRKDVVGPRLGLSLDLGLATVDRNVDRSHSSSTITIDHREDETFSIALAPYDLIKGVDESVVFKPVELAFATQEIKKAISLKFSQTMDAELSLEVEEDVLERILGGLWHDQTSLDEWINNVLEPCFDQLKLRIQLGDGIRSVVQLVVKVNSNGGQGDGEWLPTSISVREVQPLFR